MTPKFRRRAVIALAAALAVIGSSLALVSPAVADTSPTPPEPQTVSSDALPTVQIGDGVVWTQIVVGNTVYVGGEFTTARPAGAAAGTQTTPRSNFLAYNVTTGALITTFAPSFNGAVRDMAVSPDGSRLYVVGNFTQVNGLNRYRVAAFDLATGALVTNWLPGTNSPVITVAATASAVYFGGSFSTIGSSSRPRVGAVSTAPGAAVLPFAPNVLDQTVRGIEVAPDNSSVVIAGSFTQVNGSSNPGYGLVRLDPATGATLPTPANNTVRDGTTSAAIYSMSSDADSVYGTGYTFGSGGNLEGSFRMDWAGNLTWIESCLGDTYGSAALNGVVYTISHSHNCSTVGEYPQTDPWSFQRALAWTKNATKTNVGGNFNGFASPTMLNWLPDFDVGTYTGSSQAAWSIAAGGNYLVLGGEFPTVNGKGQQGLVRFAMPSVAPLKDGPRYSGANFVPNVLSFASGTARVSFPANIDRDNANLTYDVYRNGNMATPVFHTVVASKGWWNRPAISFSDSGLTPGATYTYRVRATDPNGNTVLGNTASVVVSSGAALSSYGQAVLSDGASDFWRLGQAAGSTIAYDYAGGLDARVDSGVTLGVPGAIVGDSDTAATFSGDGSGLVATTTAIPGPTTFSVEAWVNTTSTTGGKIVGFGDQSTGNSSNYDRHLYMDGSGRIYFGVYPGSSKVINTGTGFNNGAWHHIVGELSSDGMVLYVDGKKIGSQPDVTSAQPYSGFWRIGGDSTWAGDNYFDGAIDDVAVYSAPLTLAQVKNHYSLSGHAGVVPPAPTAPADAYGARVFQDAPVSYWRLNDAGATAADSGPDGTITGTYAGGVTTGVNGALHAVSNSSVAFNGTDGTLASTAVVTDPKTYSEELWFNTTTSTGGKLIGFGNTQSGNSSSYDRHVYMQNDGTLVFGAWTGQENLVTSSQSYNDGQWHHMVATQGSSGMALYVDGTLLGTNPNTGNEDHDGYWRVGGDVTWSSSSYYFNGKIDEVAIYDHVINAATVAAHYSLGEANQPPTAAFAVTGSGLNWNFDGSGSTDADGTVTGYSWNWGDGSAAGSGATASHSYASGGTYTVTLTVTDDGGLTSTVSHNVVAVAPNVLPTATFSKSATDLAVNVDGSGSVDPDGSIVSYAWTFGDGATATTPTATHSYAAGGTFQIGLTVTDDRGGQATTSQAVTVVAPIVNQPPTAAFTISGANLTASVDGGGSSDPDGTVTGYSWNWGDGTAPSAAATPTATHTYTADGTYSVTLTVTDNSGATAQVSHPESVAAPVVPNPAFAQDAFGRTNATGLGTADKGGVWTTTGSASQYSVGGGVGTLKASATSATLNGYLNSVSSSDTDLTATVAVLQQPTGSVWVSLVGRRVGTDDYRARLAFAADGSVNLQLYEGSVYLQASKVAGLSYTAGTKLDLRLQVVGVSPTSIRAKVWVDGTTEPTTWAQTRVDTAASMQAAGGVGIGLGLGSTGTAPTSVTFDNLNAVSTSGTVTPPPANVAPTAAFTSNSSNLTASFDGTTSSDSDGTVASYSWNFGDGSAAGTGSTATHNYAAAGTYQATLTVIDNSGATNAVTHPVTVTAPPIGGPLAADAFSRTVANGLGIADVGGAWTLSGTASNFAVSGGQALFTQPAANTTLNAYLNGVSATSTDITLGLGVQQQITGSGVRVSVIGRKIGGDDYRARIAFLATGQVNIEIYHGATWLQTVKVPNVTYVVGTKVNVRVQVFGANPTTIRARVWAVGTTEPTTWQATQTDTSAAMQAAGSVGLSSSLLSSATTVPLVTAVDDLVVNAGP